MTDQTFLKRTFETNLNLCYDLNIHNGKTRTFTSLHTGIVEMHEKFTEEGDYVMEFEMKVPKQDSDWFVYLKIDVNAGSTRQDQLKRTVYWHITKDTMKTTINICKIGRLPTRIYGDSEFVLICLEVNIVDQHGLPNPKSVIDNAYRMLQNSDFNLKIAINRVRYVTLKINKSVLSSKSEYFAEMFSGEYKDKELMEFNDVDVRMFSKFLALLYGVQPAFNYRQHFNVFDICRNRIESIEHILQLCFRFEAKSVIDLLISSVKNVESIEYSGFLLLAKKYNLPVIQKMVMNSIKTLEDLRNWTRQWKDDKVDDSVKNFIMKDFIFHN